jgi:alpha-D-ribose 1-methylphosphonate 5-triphosphate synthase subunit PhnI
MPRVLDLLDGEGLIERFEAGADTEPGDLTREPMIFPADRAARLQNLARGDEGFLLSLAYSTQRGYAETHPFAGEIRMGEVDVRVCPEELGFAIEIGSITVTECQMINQFQGGNGIPAQFTRGYGLSMGEGERKAMAMALVERALRCDELGEAAHAPAQDQEFVLSHSDSVEASGFVQHLKLPHYVDFQAELSLLRTLREQPQRSEPVATPQPAPASEEVCS